MHPTKNTTTTTPQTTSETHVVILKIHSIHPLCILPLIILHPLLPLQMICHAFHLLATKQMPPRIRQRPPKALQHIRVKRAHAHTRVLPPIRRPANQTAALAAKRALDAWRGAVGFHARRCGVG